MGGLEPYTKMLDMFAVAGAVSVFRCSCNIEKKKLPTESVIVTFAGTVKPTEIKAWLLNFCVEALSPHPVQCRKCWRYGHTLKGCRSDVSCRTYAEQHNTNECSTQKVICCSCSRSHAADDKSCPARMQKLQIPEIIEQKRCFLREARSVLSERSRRYATAAYRTNQMLESSLPDLIASMVKRVMTKLMDTLFVSLTESMAQVVNTQLTQVLHGGN